MNICFTSISRALNTKLFDCDILKRGNIFFFDFELNIFYCIKNTKWWGASSYNSRVLIRKMQCNNTQLSLKNKYTENINNHKYSVFFR